MIARNLSILIAAAAFAVVPLAGAGEHEGHSGTDPMAKLADRRTEHAEAKQLAASIIKDQSKELAQMKVWEKSWFGSAAH